MTLLGGVMMVKDYNTRGHDEGMLKIVRASTEQLRKDEDKILKEMNMRSKLVTPCCPLWFICLQIAALALAFGVIAFAFYAVVRAPLNRFPEEMRNEVSF